MDVPHAGARFTQPQDGIGELRGETCVLSSDWRHAELFRGQGEERRLRLQITADDESIVQFPHDVALRLFAQPFRTVDGMVLVEETVVRGDDHVADVGVGEFLDCLDQIRDGGLARVEGVAFRYGCVSGFVDAVVVDVQHAA